MFRGWLPVPLESSASSSIAQSKECNARESEDKRTQSWAELNTLCTMSHEVAEAADCSWQLSVGAGGRGEQWMREEERRGVEHMISPHWVPSGLAPDTNTNFVRVKGGWGKERTRNERRLVRTRYATKTQRTFPKAFLNSLKMFMFAVEGRAAGNVRLQSMSKVIQERANCCKQLLTSRTRTRTRTYRSHRYVAIGYWSNE